MSQFARWRTRDCHGATDPDLCLVPAERALRGRGRARPADLSAAWALRPERARLERTARHVIWAETVEVLDPSADRRDPICDPACGGALYAYIQYERQLRLKSDVIQDLAIQEFTFLTAAEVKQHL